MKQKTNENSGKVPVRKCSVYLQIPSIRKSSHKYEKQTKSTINNYFG